MAKMVGYACSIRLSWLNEAVRMLKEELPEAEYKEKMNDLYLKICYYDLFEKYICGMFDDITPINDVVKDMVGLV